MTRAGASTFVRALAFTAAAAAASATAIGCTDREARSKAHAEGVAGDGVAVKAVIDAGAVRALNVRSHGNVLFEDGFSIVSYDPPEDYRGHAFRWMGQRGHARVLSHGDKAMALRIVGWVNEKVIRAKPVVTVYLDGVRIWDTGAVENGAWGVQTVVPGALLKEGAWHDLIIAVSAVSFHWGEPPDLRVVVVSGLDWSEAP